MMLKKTDALSTAELEVYFGMPPLKAISFLRSKGYALTKSYKEMLGAAHDQAFTVAGVARVDILQDIKAALVKKMSEGMEYEDFKNHIMPTLVRKGWVAQTVKTAGQVTEVGAASRLQTIYRTNIQSAYMSGRHDAMREAVVTHPYWRYSAIRDGRTRPHHASLHGTVARADDDVWNTIYPPNGYNCRCSVIALTQAKVDREGLTVADAGGIKFKPDAGFEHRPGGWGK